MEIPVLSLGSLSTVQIFIFTTLPETVYLSGFFLRNDSYFILVRGIFLSQEVSRSIENNLILLPSPHSTSITFLSFESATVFHLNEIQQNTDF